MKSKKSIKSIIIMAIIAFAGMFFINMSLAATTGKIIVETANLRGEADANSTILEQLSLNQEVEILEKTGEWYKVKFNGMTGYIRQDLIKANEEIKEEKTEETKNEVKEEQTSKENEKTESTQKTDNNTQNQEEKVETKLGKYNLSKNVKLKIIPSINATETIEMKENEEVNVIEIINGWVCVETKTTKGWIREDCLKKEETKTEESKPEEQTQEAVAEPVKEEQKEEQKQQAEQVEQPKKETVIKTQYIGKETVNMREQPNTSSEIVTSYALNTTVEVYAEENGWSKVKVGGKEGYILTSLLADTKQETSRSLTTPRNNAQQAETTNTQTTSNENASTPAPAPAPSAGSTVIETAREYLGYKYVYGGSSPSGFDCSGFTSYVYRLHGVSLNRTAQGQFSNGVAVSRENLQPGDLVMFGTSTSNITHVAIYIGGGQILHAANPSRGVTIDTITSGYYNNKYVGARRVL